MKIPQSNDERDLELIVLGALLADQSFARRLLLKLSEFSFQEGQLVNVMSGVCEKVKSGLSVANDGELHQWLTHRGVTLGTGSSVLDSVVARVDCNGRRRLSRELCRQLTFAAGLPGNFYDEKQVRELRRRLAEVDQ